MRRACCEWSNNRSLARFEQPTVLDTNASAERATPVMIEQPAHLRLQQSPLTEAGVVWTVVIEAGGIRLNG